MKFTIVTLLALNAAGVFASPAAKDVCGDLGVMEVDLSNLPEGVDPTKIRTCADHPSKLSSENEENSPLLAKRDCWYGKTPGCSKDGWCYKSCGDAGSGQWCWAAENGGLGDWISCSSDSQCSQNMACGKGNCDACGCSC
ncbi:hypothetical protein ACO1O0_005588 [Amphichorda felina]